VAVLGGDGWVALFHGLLRKQFFVGHFSKTFAPPAMDQPYFNSEGVPKLGDEAFVHFYHKTPDGGSKKARGSPFKSTVVAIEYEPEGIMYTVRHHTDNVFDTVHISDFVTMGCGCYVRMKKVKLADARAHAQWQLIVG
jgi:hypothetical protein